MPTRTNAPVGSPCWADLWTSDVEGSRRFYGEVLGWEAGEPSPEFGGYFTFLRGGDPVAGAMGDMGEMRADNSWKIYLTTDDCAKTIEVAEAAGASVVGPAMPVADLGVQAVLVDPTGAPFGIWQPGTFAGFTVLNEAGAPSWFELHTRDYAGALSFYTSVFGLEADTIGDSDDFRYSVLRAAGASEQLAGIMDASAFLPDGEGARWSIYWEVDGVDATVAKAKALGGAVLNEPEDTPYGRLAGLADPAGARFKLRTGGR
jgi:predicted enzyme related to lactoylglutathione lyase